MEETTVSRSKKKRLKRREKKAEEKKTVKPPAPKQNIIGNLMKYSSLLKKAEELYQAEEK